MTEQKITREELLQKINLETAMIPWEQLQVFFAGGKVLHVDASLDLVQVAFALAVDDSAQFKTWNAAGLVGKVSDETAKHWFEEKSELWAVVVKPWVLV